MGRHRSIADGYDNEPTGPIMNRQQTIRINKQSAQLSILLERLLYAIVSLLVFEGLIRKLVPAAMGMVVFFLKDILCLYAIYLTSPIKLPGLSAWLRSCWTGLIILYIPLLVYTAFLDLPLSLFGAKQYLLYAIAGLIVPLAFPSERVEQFKRFASFFALLLIPTTIVSILQNALPDTHWLNLTVGGTPMTEFSAGGYLRVSSTFSFTGQYSWFLNAVCAFMIIGFFLPPYDGNSSYFLKTVMPVLLGITLTVGVFITGGRTAVLGNAGCILIGFILSSWKSPSASIRKGLLAGFFVIPAFWLLHEIKPEFFAAYEARSSGHGDASHEDEIQERILGSFLNWTEWYGDQDVASMLIGNGLGVMSNGSDRISTYANSIRSTGFWTEGDIPSTAWEGGIYLMIIWYGFRLMVVLYCFRAWQSMKDYKYSAVASFLLANVVINGIMGNIGMQPPLAIWWWLSVGAIITIHGFEKGRVNTGQVRAV